MGKDTKTHQILPVFRETSTVLTCFLAEKEKGKRNKSPLVKKGKRRILTAIPLEDTRTVSSLTRNQMPGNRLRVRIPCPPLCF